MSATSNIQELLKKDYASSRFWQELQRRVLIYDGAMGSLLQTYELTPADFGGQQYEGCNEALVLTRPGLAIYGGTPRHEVAPLRALPSLAVSASSTLP